MFNRSFIKPATLAIGSLPAVVVAHPGHGGGSALQHDWQHALWLGAAMAAVGWAVWSYRSYRSRSR
ncbi:hypothetical protein FV139_07625 [Parahaliea maris]|uniref:Uncharacterized protein n=1 Tax=Parahaliea maris TaxID=2716870 RepID=A0A5C9A6M6_9GAMM|nr:hypothetical protein [Parahaliea maris]TXS95729.1 hypothetical protein FV139_07625 [Parahaliea maris]